MTYTVAQIEEIGFETHRMFISNMYEYFGIRDVPDSVSVSAKPLDELGLFVPEWTHQHGKWQPSGQILLDARYFSRSTEQEIIHTAAHESGHYLHFKRNVRLYGARRTRHVQNLLELVAEYSAFLFIDECCHLEMPQENNAYSPIRERFARFGKQARADFLRATVGVVPRNIRRSTAWHMLQQLDFE